MKFFCEYCGNRIDADVDKKCPECGAAYDNNVTFKELQEKRKQAIQNTTKAGKTVLKVFAIQYVFSAIIVLLIFGFVGFFAYKQIKKDISPSINENSKMIEAKLGEYAETSKYKVTVTGYEKDESLHITKNAGYEYIKFNLQVENLTSRQIRSEDVNCIVDGVAQTNETYSGHSTLPFFIGSKLTVKGEAVFEVPVSATSYDIKYGDNVLIHIEK